MNRWFIIYRELLSTSFKEYIRDPIPTIFTTFMPLMFLLIFGFTSKFVGTTNSVAFYVSVGDKASQNGQASLALSQKEAPQNEALKAQIIDILAKRSIFIVSQATEQESRKSLAEGKLHASVLIDEQGELTILSMASTETVSAMMQELLQDGLSESAQPIIQATRVADAPTLKQETLEVEQFSYIGFLLPAILALSLVQLCLYGTATPLVSAKERGILRYFAVVPMPKSALLAAQITVRFCLSAVQLGLLLVLAAVFFDMTIKGSVIFLTAFLSLSAVMLITGGYALGGLFKSLTVATAVIMVLNFYLMTFGQIFVDFSSIPVARYLVMTTPVGFVSDGTRQIISDSAGMFPMYVNVLGVLGWLAVLTMIAVKYFQFLPKSE